MKHRRCLIIADGFYEWQRIGRGKQPHYITMHDQEPFAFAGLWERWSSPGSQPIASCTILTTAPNELMEPIHNRMPVILPPERYEQWLDPDMHDSQSLEPMLRPYPSDAMLATPVSTLVNSPANDTKACTEPG